MFVCLYYLPTYLPSSSQVILCCSIAALIKIDKLARTFIFDKPVSSTATRLKKVKKWAINPVYDQASYEYSRLDWAQIQSHAIGLSLLMTENQLFNPVHKVCLLLATWVEGSLFVWLTWNLWCFQHWPLCTDCPPGWVEPSSTAATFVWNIVN